MSFIVRSTFTKNLFWCLYESHEKPLKVFRRTWISLYFIKTFLAAMWKMNKSWGRENILNILPQYFRQETIMARIWVIAAKIEEMVGFEICYRSYLQIWQMRGKKKREIKSITLVLDLSNYHPSDSTIEHEWADKKREKICRTNWRILFCSG